MAQLEEQGEEKQGQAQGQPGFKTKSGHSILPVYGQMTRMLRLGQTVKPLIGITNRENMQGRDATLALRALLDRRKSIIDRDTTHLPLGCEEAMSILWI